MTAGKILVGILSLAIGLPVLFLLLAAGTFYILDRTNGSIVSSGQEREYLLYVPASYDPATPAPLVISLHGAALWPAAQMEISRWNRIANEQGVIVVYPSGTGFPNVWRVSPGARLAADVRFISDLVDALEASYNIDPARIYANGFSNGGGMTFALSCSLAHRLAAVGTVAAAQSLPWNWCADPEPMPMIAFHGTADPMVPYEGGASGDPASPRDFPSVTSWTANWAQRNRCAPDPVETVVATDVIRLQYLDCANDAAVALYTIRGGGHSWPGGEPLPEWLVGSTRADLDTTGLMWEFFRRHRLGAHPAHRRGRVE